MRRPTSDTPPFPLRSSRGYGIGTLRMCAVVCALFLSLAAPIPSATAQVDVSDSILGTSAADRGIDQEELPDISSPHAMVMGQDGTVYFARNADEPIKIASVTKVMTALVALEHCDPDDIVTVDHAAATVGESCLGLMEGDTLTMENALIGLMVMSGNDAAMAIAATAGAKIDPGSADPYATFIDAMNQKAAELGCEDTVYENPHGLDFDGWAGDLHSTTRDATTIFAAAMKNERFRSIDGSECTSIPVTSADGSTRTIDLIVRNEIRGQQGNIGGKTGTTFEAGNCFVGAFSRDLGGEVYVAVFGAADNASRFADTIALANWYYDHIANVPLLNTSVVRNGIPIVGEAPCTAWCDRAVGATVEDADATATVFSLGGELTTDISFDELRGAVERGDEIGTLTLSQGDSVVGEVELIATESVPAPNPVEWLMVKFDRIVRFFEGRPTQADELVIGEAPDPCAYDSWGTE